MIYNTPAPAASVAPGAAIASLNPDSGAAEFLSPGSIGAAVQTDNTPPSDYTGTTGLDWLRYMWRNNLIGVTAHLPQMPGYSAPAPVMVTVQNTTFGGKEGTTQFPSIESALQRAVQGLAGTAFTQNWTDQRVMSFLASIARDSDAWNGNADPGEANIPALVAKYVAVYRVAVTPA
ncbi:MAG: hypothetical protein V4502_08005 [Pseudomonadota bacterium]